MSKKMIVIFILLINIIYNAFADDINPELYRKLLELNSTIEEKLNKGEKCNKNYLDNTLKPLLQEIVVRGQIWQEGKSTDKLPSFQSFLSSHIGNHFNPYFSYAWKYYTNSDQFKDESLLDRQKTCYVILKMLYEDNFKKEHEFLYWTLFTRCCKNNCFNEHSRNLAQKIIMKHKNKYSIRLLLFLDRKFIEYP